MTHKSSRHLRTISHVRPVNRRPLALAISTLLLGSALAGPAQPQLFPAEVKLADLDGSSGFRLDGVTQFDISGRSVSAAGDINGDGIDDLIIGAYAADPDGNTSAGSTYVVFGRDASVDGNFPAVVKLAELDGTNGFRIDGVAEADQSGWSVSAAGDINGDGIDDLIIGAFGADQDGNSNVGSSYVVFGRDSGFPATLNLATLDGITGFRLDGVAANDFSGRSVSAAGDINGDGIDDLIIGAYRAAPGDNPYAGSSYVVFGRDVSVAGDFPPVVKLADLDGSTGFRLDGVAAGDRSGGSVSAIGDINGDGIDDLIIGATGASPDGNTNAGSSYVVFGRDVSVAGDFPATLALSSLNGSNGFRIDGEAQSDQAGLSVSAAGDINGDGIDDLIIGALVEDSYGNINAGSSYVVFGRDVSLAGAFSAVLKLADLNGSDGFRLDGVAGEFSGTSVSAAGDINDDGIDDLIIGAPGAAPDGISFAGSSYVVFGRNVSVVGNFPATLALSSLDGNTGFRIDGVAENDLSGRSVSAAGDINGDGIDDLIIGASSASPDGNSGAGSSFVLFGRRDAMFFDRFEPQ